MTSRLCPTAPRNFGKRGEGGLWGCSCDSLCLCVPLHPPEALQDAAVPPGPRPGALCVCGGPGAEGSAGSGERRRDFHRALGRKPPGGFTANVPKVPAAELSWTCVCPGCPRPGDEFAVLALVCPLQTEKKNGSKAPFGMKCQLGARGAVKAVPGEDCRPLEPRAAPTVSVLNLVGNAPGVSLCFISPFLPLFLTKEKRKPRTPQDGFHSC